MSSNLNKKTAEYYYYWRWFITILIPLREYFLFITENKCYYLTLCTNFMFYICITTGLTIIDLYFAKIAWSFSARLNLGQELLVIHGKYLEKMLSIESNKNIYTSNNTPKNIYVPPSKTNSNNLKEMDTIRNTPEYGK